MENRRGSSKSALEVKVFPEISAGKQPPRSALSRLQNSGTPGENEMVGRQKVVNGSRKGSERSSKSPDKAGTPKATPTTKVRNGFITKRKYAEKGIQTLNPDVELITGDEPTLTYWKELAETRRQALEETLQENQNLHERVDELEKENRVLEEMLEDAKRLAEIISSISDDDNPDESGIGQDSEVTGYDHDVSASSP